MPSSTHCILGSLVVATALVAKPARASDFVDGHLVFAKDALKTYSFESIADLNATNTQHVAWQKVNGGEQLVVTALDDGDDQTLLADDALEGHHGLLLTSGNRVGVSIADGETFSANAGKRISISMWGKAMGAEPVLELVYAHTTEWVGPDLIHTFALRTGRETTDGWVEYSTGPMDGSAFGVASGTPLRAIVLSARYATTGGISTLLDEELEPGNNPAIVENADGFAVVDAVEIRPEAGRVVEPASCTVATVRSRCDESQDCMFGHCVDAALMWGPVPISKQHRSDLIARWAFVAQSIQSDRQSIAIASTLFQGAASKLAAETSPRAYYAKLNEMVGGLHDSHTRLGNPPSNHSVLWPYAGTESGPIDACFGLAENDLGDDSTVFAVYDVGTSAGIGEVLKKGDLVTAIDGMAPLDWLDTVAARLQGAEPPDQAARPSNDAIHLGELIGRFAETLSVSRCTSGGGCTKQPDIAVGSEIFSRVQAGNGTGGYSLTCSLRFHPSVSTPPPPTGANEVAEESTGGITSVQFDGFEGLYDSSKANPFEAWEDPMTAAFSAGTPVLVDARVGFGGYFTLGEFLFQLVRGTDQPYGMYAVPRGAFDDPDPAWLFSGAFDGCATLPQNFTLGLCEWTGGQMNYTANAAPAGGATKVAWVNGNDVSMNDIVPRLFQGRANFKVFGPHPTHGSYGEIAKVPRIGSAWSEGSIQVLDMRFGTSPADARTQRWESGHGVVPDVVIVQKISDILLDQDTILAAARAWLGQ